ncbi:peptidoglycan DD-metalloendopeptidase family protein [Vibrio tubiashii]|uniref:Peptidase M23 n=1 Tax=Vibrio tubiashii ATCC 19109 TaxID=1051646 RepID=F9TCC6_9VIBR|nr:peptidoglycan DD-metalloendopeptidase family protein [Vibrio tubiashii]AIW13539.1 peptidase M23 [Vibrio tubiashii ATCC 19109]EGU47894.1 hypothetical protein VITU9109_03022 [Vibrio tubiashii ATCC 19109]EIF04174.1 hypothetical protein VT1337_09597 [Vibrio tubiashii NCIMB 1337 = ATCC 19106]
MTSLILRQNSNNIALALFVTSVALVIGVSITRYTLSPDYDLEAPRHLTVSDEYTDSLPRALPKSESIITGSIDYSFVNSILNSGLSNKEITTLLNLIGDEFDIIGSVKKGDRFAIKLNNNNHNERSIRSFYYNGSESDFFISTNKNNEALNQFGEKVDSKNAYKYPLSNTYKVSSEFSLKRLHPITNRVMPHLGTDYAVPVGTPIHSIADGRVIKSRYNRFAGHYINIQHSDGAVSRYLHLSKRSVQTGDRVSQGQEIGRSGNSGRTTGPHLHIELILNGKHVNFERHTAPNLYTITDPKKLIATQKERTELIQALSHARLGLPKS